MSRLDTRFAELKTARRPGLIPFVTCGDPAPELNVALLHALVASGADAIELGMPFSDPAADGPVIQHASERAIAKGTNLASALNTVREFRTTNATTPIVLMGYLNPLEQYGRGKFFADASSAGVDALLIVDCPIEESAALQAQMQPLGLQQIFLVAPTSSPARRARMAEAAQGFLYYVSFSGITGAGKLDTGSVLQTIRELRAQSQVPVAVGFGIRDAKSAAELGAVADAVVIGSALVEHLAGAQTIADLQARVQSFLGPIYTALLSVKN